MLQFLYTGKYETDLGSFSIGKSPAEIDAQLYALGDKYDIVTLKRRALNRFRRSVNSFGTQVDLIPNLLEAVYMTTPSVDRSLRDIVKALLIRHKVELRAHNSFVDLFQNKLDGDSALEVLDAFSGLGSPTRLSTNLTGPRFARCPQCNTDTIIAWCRDCKCSRELMWQDVAPLCKACGECNIKDIGCTRCREPVVLHQMI